ncbi:MAG: hypothetical protein ACRD1T_26160 [Acidimicrobiia bacterium]
MTSTDGAVSLCGQATSQETRMKVIAGGCFDGTCPTIYATDRGTVVVQGQQVTDREVTLGPGEVLVEIPADLLKEANA